MLTELTAILIYLASQHQEIWLNAGGPDGLVRAVEWFNWLSSAVHAVAVRMVWRADFFSDDPATHPAIVSKGHEHLAHAHALIEQRLKGRDYAVGNAYSIVDPCLLVYFRWGNRMHLDMAGRFPAWTAHARRLEARSAVQRASLPRRFRSGLSRQTATNRSGKVRHGRRVASELRADAILVFREQLATAALGTGLKTSALQQFRQVSEGLLPCRRGNRHASS